MISHSEQQPFRCVITTAASGGRQFTFAASLMLSLFIHLAAYSTFVLRKTNTERTPQKASVIEVDLSQIKTASNLETRSVPIHASNPGRGTNAVSRTRVASIQAERLSLEQTTPKNTEPPAPDPEPRLDVAMKTVEVNAGGSSSGTGMTTLPANAKTAGTAAEVAGESGEPRYGDGQTGKESLADYSHRIRALIERHKKYPLAARKMGVQGSVVVSFSLDSHGELRVVSLAKSSGDSTLDNAGMRAVRNVGKFPPPPRPVMQGDEVSFRIPITFAITLG
jgi:TonB family protein